MPLSNSNVEPKAESELTQEDVYSGETSFLYSSKIRGRVGVASLCEILVASDAFSFALDSHGRIYFKERGRLKTQQLIIETTITEQGMTIQGHNDFMSANPGESNIYALSNALNLLLSDKKLFNTDFGFPAESARIFMRPIAIKTENSDKHEVFVPYFRIHAGGIISISLPSASGFEDATVREVIDNEVNKSRINITSLLCEKELHSACTECQISQMSFQQRISEKKVFEDTITSALNTPKELMFSDERLTVYELVHTNQFTLTDIARNLLSVVARAVNCGKVRTRINWIGKQYRDDSIGEYWHGKPILYVRTHSRQKSSSSENWAEHKRLVNSVMTRIHFSDVVTHATLNHSDLRFFDDFNNFYSEGVSLMLSSAQVESFIEQSNSYTFDNVTSDIQILNEASHYIQIYYSYASLSIGRCKTAMDVARLELEILKFEETLLSAHKHGEIAKYIEEVRRGDHLTTVCKLLHKKIEMVRKSLELDEKISSESYTRRITIIFGIIASATLSPELMQPLAKHYGITFADDQVSKLAGIAASVIVVIVFLTLTNYAFRLLNKIIQKIRT